MTASLISPQPTLIFVNSMSDFFLESVTDELRDRLVDIMEQTPRHEYQVLTKRPREMLRYSKRRKLPPNFWAGVSVDTQHFVTRLDLLREVDVEIRFLSAEPILSHLDLNLDGIHWCIAGGESGKHLLTPEIRSKRSLADYNSKTKKWTPRADRYHWITDIRDQCIQAGVAFFFKQWGGAAPKSSGNLLDGKTWEEFPRLPKDASVDTDIELKGTMKQIEQVIETPSEYQLSKTELAELTTLEATIERSLKAFWEVGNALLTIRENRLYRVNHGTFETYCIERWGFTDEQARRLMRGSEVVAKLQQTPPIGGLLPTNENQVRPLTQLKEPELQRLAWQKAVGSTSDGIPTAAHVSKAVQEVKEQALSTAHRPRIENDFYPTTTRLTEVLLKQIDITGKVLEPCAGDGAIAKLIPNCSTNDLYAHPDFDCNYNLDATLRETWQEITLSGIDWVVTNPSFELAPLIIPLAFEHVQVGIAMLLRLTYLEPCANRRDWLEAHADHLRNIIVLNPRPQFRSDTTNNDNVTVAWFVWRKDCSWKSLGIECPFMFAHNWKSALAAASSGKISSGFGSAACSSISDRSSSRLSREYRP